MAENDITPPLLGVAWDGSGWGFDGTVWGGEFFDLADTSCRRVAHMRPFRLPGGDAAVKEPRRSAAGLLAELYGVEKLGDSWVAPHFTASERAVVARMLHARLNAPLTSSIGRLFDAMASLLGLRQVTRHEGQAAMELEFAAQETKFEGSYPAALKSSSNMLELDWEPMLLDVLRDLAKGVCKNQIAAAVHNTLADWIVAVAQRVGHGNVVLSGGCFQNVLLLETTIKKLSAAGHQPFWHQRVPTNDGGIALGQIIAAERRARLSPDGIR